VRPRLGDGTSWPGKTVLNGRYKKEALPMRKYGAMSVDTRVLEDERQGGKRMNKEEVRHFSM